MAITENTYTGNGSQVLFTFSFPYLSISDIRVSLNGIITTGYTFPNSNTIQFNTAPAVGVAIRIYRETEDTTPVSQFFSGSAIRAQDLNDNANQAVYLTQEVRNIAVSASTANIANNSITSDKLATDAVSTTKIADGAVTTPKLGTSAVTQVKIADGSVSAAKAVIASQAQAEAGTDTTTLMTPLRTAQAIKGVASFQEFTSSGTWTKPSNCNYVMVEVWGAGGGGSSGDRQNISTFRYGGAGGGGGAYNYRLFRASELGATESITIGTGGTGGVVRTTDGTGTAGTGGGSTSFGTKVSAFGGASGDNSLSGRSGGGGGGTLGAPVTISNIIYGGQPQLQPGSDISNSPAPTWEIYGGGRGSRNSPGSWAGRSMYGGGGGGYSTATTASNANNGARSLYGGCGGGTGGTITNSSVTYDTGNGGSQTTDWGGGGTPGATGGNPGGAGAIFQGGGGGGSGVTVNAGTGGAGGIAGGGGGGGAGTGTFNSGAGGAGGAGLCRVWTW